MDNRFIHPDNTDPDKTIGGVYVNPRMAYDPSGFLNNREHQNAANNMWAMGRIGRTGLEPEFE